MRRARLAWLGVAVCLIPLAGCRPNPRNEIAGIADAAMAEVQRTAPAARLCVDRVIAPWQPPRVARRIDPPAPPGYEDLYATGTFRGGGGVRGATIGGVPVAAHAGCLSLRGPLVRGDRAMIEVHQPGVGWNAWLAKTQDSWRVVMTTTSVYRG